MKISTIPFESKLFNGNVIQLSEWDKTEDIISAEAGIIEQYKPVYIFCALNSTEISAIQYLEKNGYGFSEFRIYSNLQLKDTEDSRDAMFPYQIRLLGDEGHLQEVKSILSKNMPDDRYFNDPLIDKNLARSREIRNIEKSFHSWPKEFIAGLFNVQTNKLIGFRSGALRNDMEADYYLYGIAPGYEKQHYSKMLDHLCIGFLHSRGIRIIHSVTTGFNTEELNRLIKHHDFRIENTKVMMRKVISPNYPPIQNIKN